MTVQELIDKLTQLPEQEAEVMVYNHHRRKYEPIVDPLVVANDRPSKWSAIIDGDSTL